MSKQSRVKMKQKKKQKKKKIEINDLPRPERIRLAEAKMTKIIDHFLYVIELHANNSFVVFSPLLASQIPRSYAANAFNAFQRSMLQIEIVRLCAIWDGIDLDKENIPTVVELIDDAEIIEMLAEEERGRHMFGRADAYADERASLALTGLEHAIKSARTVLSSTRLNAIMNIRDKHLAHSLETTRREKNGPVQPMKHGDETKLLNASIPIVEQLYCWVNGTSFSFENSQEIDQRNAEALWTGCKFVDLR
ncbi:hypothetical protein [Bradyrhizobium sp. CB2312]|uniref:AbiU2 domain-containing protein n=1 Tax=Bradyrhizobium sp. CB2312 TaxID=3039155 RepID=UPI0024B26675|nr:hypothetical protein [Bradyrhizobium sp. CB2312]WFU75240.1 hypothetical protein QA642_15050 [Bradyrhizobium sp. CB2312]